MNSFRLHCSYNLIIAGFVSCLICQSLAFFSADSASRIVSLHDLAFRLGQKGLTLRSVSPREDGLWLTAIYLTRTEKSVADLKKLTIDPTRVEPWQGTVVVFADEALLPHDTSDWGENGLSKGPFVFFGDKEVLLKIAKALEDTEAPEAAAGWHSPFPS